MSLLLSLYGMAWTAAMPFLRRNKRLGDGFAERLAPPAWPWGEGNSRPAGPVVWMQAASGGEAGLVTELARELDAGLPSGSHLTVLATTFTRQGLDVLEKIPSSARLTVVSRYFPLDKPSFMARAIASAAPDCMVLLETELWPGLLHAAKYAGVPVFILNGRMTAKSLSGYSWLPGFWKAMKPSRVLAISNDDAERFGRIFGRDLVGLMPNIKFDSVRAQAGLMEDAEAARLSAGFGADEPVIALASVRQEEEEALRPVVARLAQSSIQGRPVRVVVAPRHMHRVEVWQKYFPEAALASQGASASPILIWDVFGRLKELYAAADAAFVGGSLAPLGGQNFLEALAQGLKPVIGPHWKNFLWVGREIMDQGLVEQISQAGELLPRLLALAEARLQAGRDEDREATRQAFLHWLQPRTGGAAQAADLILRAIKVSLSPKNPTPEA